jgi:hypothetical protein
MKGILLFGLWGVLLYSPEALADVAPGKIGCSTAGGFEMGLVLLPLVIMGALMYFRREQTEKK